MALLEVKNLGITYHTKAGAVPAAKNISFSLEKGSSLGLIGESGSGKTTIGLGLMGLLSDNATVDTGEVLFNDEDLLTLPGEAMMALRGKKISMIFQAAMNSLNPVHRVGDQVAEVMQVHCPELSKSQVNDRVKELFDDVGLSLSRRWDYPHQYSGGMKQRAVIAMALACSPDLIIADEPTTALDMTVQSQILKKLVAIQQQKKISVLLISHDIGVVSEICHDIAVMYQGEMVEYGTRDKLLASPSHDFTKKLMAACLTISKRNLPLDSGEASGGGAAFHAPVQATSSGDDNGVIAAFHHVSKSYGSGGFFLGAGRKKIAALKDVSFEIRRGEIFGLVGASGSGKTILGRILLKLENPDGGTLLFNNEDAGYLKRRRLKAFRRKVQMISQDPYQSLNPYFNVYDIVAEPLIIHEKKNRKAFFKRICTLLEHLGLCPVMEYLHRYPHQLSGGQRQKVAITRAMVLNPQLMVADEPTSMLDSSVSMQIFNILLSLKRNEGITFLFITHNIAAAHLLCDRIAVIHNGEIVETGECREVINHPRAAHTKELIDSQPGLILERNSINTHE